MWEVKHQLLCAVGEMLQLSFDGWTIWPCQPASVWIVDLTEGSVVESSLRVRRLKGKGKGALGKGVLGARETRGAREEGGREMPARKPCEGSSNMTDICMVLDQSVSPRTGVRTIQNTRVFWQAVFQLPLPYSLFLEHGSAAKPLISHPRNTASYAG